MAVFTQHWITKISARRHDYANAPLTLDLRAQYCELPIEVTLYLENDDLTKALVRAINLAVAEHAERTVKQPEEAA